MTIQDGIFTAMDPQSLQVDRPILAGDAGSLAENINYLYKIATGEELPGGSNPDDGHDHENNGGPPIPLWTCYEIGSPSVTHLNGYDTFIPFKRLHTVADPAYNISKNSPPNPTVTSYPTSNTKRIWVDGDKTGVFDAGHYLTLDDGNNNGRYVYKHSQYESSVSATLVTLYDYLDSTPGSGTGVGVYRELGDMEFYVHIPEWAELLTVLLAVTCTNSSSDINGNTWYSVDFESDYSWGMGARLAGPSISGEWMHFHPKKDIVPIWAALRLDVSSLAKDTTHTFHIDLDFNEKLQVIYPVLENQRDTALWFKFEGSNPRPRTYAVLTRRI